ncbi:MAG: LysR family transcriptional regulator [Pseudobacteriovorax sp.]|nr:LysR family transcriptional regulator [Pseudobacteriovorax sp.]
MDFRYLKAFIATAENGSFSKAAEKLNIAQSAVSRQIRLLEDSIDQELILRSSKQLVLTPKGQEVLSLSRSFLNDIDHSLSDSSPKTIHVGIIHGLLESWFPEVIKTYYQNHQNNLSIQIASFQKLQERLSDGRYDIIFIPYNLQSDIVSSRLIFQESRKIASATPVVLEELSSQRWIIYNQEDLLLKLKLSPPKQMIEVNSITSMLRFVKDGLGVAVLPDHILKNEPNLHTIELPKHEQSAIYMATLNYAKLPEYIKDITEKIIASPPQAL